MNIIEKLKEIFENKPTDMRNLALSNIEKKLDETVQSYEKFGLIIYHLVLGCGIVSFILTSDLLAKLNQDIFLEFVCEDHDLALARVFYLIVNITSIAVFVMIKNKASELVQTIYTAFLCISLWGMSWGMAYYMGILGVTDQDKWTHVLFNGMLHSGFLIMLDTILDIEDIDLYFNYLLIKYNLKG